MQEVIAEAVDAYIEGIQAPSKSGSEQSSKRMISESPEGAVDDPLIRLLQQSALDDEQLRDSCERYLARIWLSGERYLLTVVAGSLHQFARVADTIPEKRNIAHINPTYSDSADHEARVDELLAEAQDSQPGDSLDAQKAPRSRTSRERMARLGGGSVRKVSGRRHD